MSCLPPADSLWYLQCGKMSGDEFQLQSQASGVLVSVKEGKGDPFKVLVTVQHAIRTRADQKRGIYDGPYWTSYFAWPCGAKYTAPEDRVALELYQSLNPDPDSSFQDANDLAFLRIVNRAEGWPAATVAAASATKVDQTNLNILGYDTGTKIIGFSNHNVIPIPHRRWTFHAHCPGNQTNILSDGGSPPVPGSSGGGIFSGETLVGIYRGDFAGNCLGMPIERVHEWVESRGHRLIVRPPPPPPPPPPPVPWRIVLAVTLALLLAAMGRWIYEYSETHPLIPWTVDGEKPGEFTGIAVYHIEPSGQELPAAGLAVEVACPERNLSFTKRTNDKGEFQFSIPAEQMKIQWKIDFPGTPTQSQLFDWTQGPSHFKINVEPPPPGPTP